MKNILILTLIVLGALSCKKEDVEPNNNIVSKPVINLVNNKKDTIHTNHVKITVNGYEVGDSLNITTDKFEATVHLLRLADSSYYLCNLTNNLFSIRLVNNCNDSYIELIGINDIKVNYKGDVDVDYLEKIE